MSELIQSRRRLLKGAAAWGVSSGLLAGCAAPGGMTPGAPAVVERRLGRVGVIGAGFGGATAARYLKHWGGSSLDVVLIERNPQFVSCPLSNLVLGGTRRIEDLTMGYQGLREAGVTVLVDEVTQIDPIKKVVSLVKIADQTFDRLVVAPGVDFQFDQIQGLNAEAQKNRVACLEGRPTNGGAA